MDIKAIINQVKVDMYGHDLGEEVIGVYGHTKEVTPVIVVDKKYRGHNTFSYLVRGKANPNYLGHAQSYANGTILIDNARIVGSDEDGMGVKTMKEAFAQVWF